MIFKKEGFSLVLLLGIIFFLTTIMFLSLMRSESALKLVKTRYLFGVARDLGENGVEYQMMALRKGPGRAAYKMDFGEFAEYQGSFESSRTPLESGGFEIISRGRLQNPKQRTVECQITARVRQGTDGKWETFYWNEKGANEGEEK